MVDFVKAIKLPFTNLVTLVIGIVVSIIPIVNLLSLGFALKVGENATKGKVELAEWKDFVDLFVKGLLGVIITIIYLIPALVVMAATMGTIFLQLAMSGTGLINPMNLLTSANAGLMGVGLLVGGILALLAALYSPVALLHFVNTKKIGKAFALGEISKKVWTGAYIVSWIVAVIYMLIVFAILGAIFTALFVPFIGTAIAMWVAMVTNYALFGQAYKEVK